MRKSYLFLGDITLARILTDRKTGDKFPLYSSPRQFNTNIEREGQTNYHENYPGAEYRSGT